MTYRWNRSENTGDRVILEQAEAREIFRTWESNKNQDFVHARLNRAEKIYGFGAKNRIRVYMDRLKAGLLL